MTEKKILIVEDDPDHAELIIEGLNAEDIKNKVILMKNGQEVIDYFKESVLNWEEEIQSIISLIILDLNIPKVHGLDVLKFLKNNSRYSSIPVIIFSTSSDHKTIENAYENGVNGFITKPLSYDDFVEKLRTLKEYC